MRKKTKESLDKQEKEEWETYEHLRRGEEADTLLPPDFWPIFTQRLFPCLSLVYIASAFGIALERSGGENALLFLLMDGIAYKLAFLILLWAVLPALVWTALRSDFSFRKYAETWYIWTAVALGALGLIFFLLFPTEGSMWGLKPLFVASIPVHIVMYILFLKSEFPPALAWPVSLTGIIFMLYGLVFV